MTAPWRSILIVVTDPFSDRQLALDKAVRLVGEENVRATLFNCFMIPQPMPGVPQGNHKTIIRAARKERLARLEALAGARCPETWDVRCVSKWEYPAHESIAHEVSDVGAEVVFLSSQRHSRIARWFLTNTDWELIRSCAAPMWFVRQPQWPIVPKVLVAVDPFHVAEKKARMDQQLLQAAEDVTSGYGGAIHVLHVASAARSKEDTRKKVEATLEACFIEPAKLSISPGVPEQLIPQYVEREKINLLIMGALSRQRSDGVVGHTAERVIDHVQCDLLVVKPAGFKAPARSAARKSMQA